MNSRPPVFIDLHKNYIFKENCRNPLGMQSGHILDIQLSSSSSYDDLTLGPTSSRIRTEKNGGAWCPKLQITSNTHEYLQINLKTLHVITMIETQGRFGNGQGIELTEQYRVEYSRDKIVNNHTKWIKYKDRENNQVIHHPYSTRPPSLTFFFFQDYKRK